MSYLFETNLDLKENSSKPKSQVNLGFVSKFRLPIENRKDDAFDELESLGNDQNISWDDIKHKISSQAISEPKLVEIAMSTLILDENKNKLLKFLDIDKVPPLPIDTKFDLGRRFLYFIKIINNRAGLHIIRPYLDGIICRREQEYRFLGGVYLSGLSLDKAISHFHSALNMSHRSEMNWVNHKHLLQNYLLCLAYLNQTEDVHSFIDNNKKLFEEFKSDQFIKRILLMERVKSGDLNGFKDDFKNSFGKSVKSINHNEIGLLNLQLSYFSKVQDQSNFKIFLDIYKNNLLKRIKDGKIDPTRAIGYLKYIFSLGGKSDAEIFDELGQDFSFYPYHKVDYQYCQIEKAKDVVIGSANSPNYIYPSIGEYKINNILGVGLKKEVKLIYFLALAGDLGMSFEEINYHVNGEHDLAGLLLVNDRVKQLILRVRKIYGINISRAKFRAYLPKEELSKFHINSTKTLSIPNGFSKEDYMNFYGVSEFTAKSRIKEFIEKKIIKSRLDGKKKIYEKL